MLQDKTDFQGTGSASSREHRGASLELDWSVSTTVCLLKISAAAGPTLLRYGITVKNMGPGVR